MCPIVKSKPSRTIMAVLMATLALLTVSLATSPAHAALQVTLIPASPTDEDSIVVNTRGSFQVVTPYGFTSWGNVRAIFR